MSFYIDFMAEVKRGHTHRNKNEANKNKKDRVAAALITGSVVQEICTGRPQRRTEGLPLARHFSATPTQKYGDAKAVNPDEEFEFKGSQPKRSLEPDLEQCKSVCVESVEPTARQIRSTTNSRQPAFRGRSTAPAAPPIAFFSPVIQQEVNEELGLMAEIMDMSQSYDNTFTVNS